MAKEKKRKERIVGTAKGKGTRYACKYSTTRKKAGTTYSPKW